MAQVVDTMLQQYAGIGFSVRTGNGETLLRWVAGGEVDIALCLRARGAARRRADPCLAAAARRRRRARPRADAASGKLRLRDCLAYPLALPAPDMELRLMAERIARARAARAEPGRRDDIGRDGAHPRGRRHARRSAGPGEHRPGRRAGPVCAGCRSPTPRRVRTPCLYQRVGQTTAAATGVFVQFLDAAMDQLSGALAAG